jgi:polyisoprenoid-binding protein YceI
MKNILIIVAILAVAGAGIWFYLSSRDSANVDATVTENQADESADTNLQGVPARSTTTMETGTYAADTSISSILWQAGKPAISGYVHHGNFSLESGEIVLTDGELSGEFVVDMDSLKVTSLGGGKAGQESTLEGHLKSDRFFDATVHPTATFTITDVEPKTLPGPDHSDYTATGELTLKGQTKAISFPIKVIVVSENETWVTASLPLDRTEWGIDFGSSKVAEAVTDQIIGDTVELDLVVKLTK